MKASHLVFAASLVVNVGVLAAFASHPALAPRFLRNALHPSHAHPTSAPRINATTSSTAPTPGTLWPLLATDDLPTLISRLRATGFPASVIREIVRAAVDAHYRPRLRAHTEPDPDTPYWKTPLTTLRSGSGRWEEYSQLLRERAKLLRDLFADPFFATDDITAGQRRQFGNLTRQQIDAVQRIEDDYAEMMSAVRTAAQGVMLAEDREKLAFLEREKRADLATVLSPAELDDYELRSSPATQMLASGSLGEFRATEAEFRAIYDMQKRLNEAFPYSGGIDPSSYQKCRELERSLTAELRDTLGDARFNDYARETDRNYQTLRRLVERENLPPETATRAFDLRHVISQESMRIHEDATLSADAKRAALATLAQKMRTDTLAMLGPVAGPAYIKLIENQWLRFLERGAAVTFDGGTLYSTGSNNVMVSIGSGPNFHSVPPDRPAPRR